MNGISLATYRAFTRGLSPSEEPESIRDVPTCEQILSKQIKCYDEFGFHEVLRRILDDELSYRTLQQLPHDSVLINFYLICAGMNHDIFQALLRGTLPSDFHTPGGAVGTALRDMSRWTISGKRPAIYSNHMVYKDTGISPTAEEVESVLEDMEKYAKSDEDDFARIIDGQVGGPAPAKTVNGYRRYLSTDKDKAPSKERLSVLDNFVRQVRHRIKHLPRGKQHPLQPALNEYGYTINIAQRLQAHREHKDSNYLMNLFEAVAMKKYGGKIRIQQHVIYLIPFPPLAALSEILLTRLGLGYTGGGCGFSHAAAGISNNSAYVETDESWKTWRSWTYSKIDIPGNKKKILEPAKRYIDRMNAEAAIHEKTIERYDKYLEIARFRPLDAIVSERMIELTEDLKELHKGLETGLELAPGEMPAFTHEEEGRFQRQRSGTPAEGQPLTEEEANVAKYLMGETDTLETTDQWAEVWEMFL